VLPRLWGVTVATVVAGVAAIACASDARTTTPSTSNAVASSAFQSTDQPLMSALLKIGDAVGVMESIVSPVVQECMAAKGFDYNVIPYRVNGGAAFFERRYGEAIEFDDESIGWASDAVAEQEAIPEPIGPTGVPGFDSPEYQLALNGAQVESFEVEGSVVQTLSLGDGCYGDAVRAVYASSESYFEFWAQIGQAESLAIESYTLLRSSPEFLTANEQWRTCMDEQGFDFDLIFDPIDFDWGSPRPSEAEQRAAKADRGCRASSRLDSGSLAAIEADIQADLLEENSFDLVEFDARLKESIDRAGE
jgi:hypothetical protein